MPVPLDEYPIHQAPLSMAYMDTSDRNAYDRCYLNAHDRSGEVFLSHARLGSRYTIRLAIGHLRTTERHTARAWTLLREGAVRLAPGVLADRKA